MTPHRPRTLLRSKKEIAEMSRKTTLIKSGHPPNPGMAAFFICLELGP